MLYLAGPTVHNLVFHINQNLQGLSERLEDNNLVLNVSETKCVLFTSQRHKERERNLNLNLLGKSITYKTSFKYLDVVFDNFMTWRAHADYECKKVATRVSIQLTLTLKMTIAQVVETSVTVNNNSLIQDYVHPNDQT